MHSLSTVASTSTPTVTNMPVPSPSPARPGRKGAGAAKKVRAPQSLDPTLNLQQLAITEQIKYEGSGRNIFVSQAEEIPKPITPGTADGKKDDAKIFQPPARWRAAASDSAEILRIRKPSRSSQKKIFFPKAMTFSLPARVRSLTADIRFCGFRRTQLKFKNVVGSGPPQSIPADTELERFWN